MGTDIKLQVQAGYEFCCTRTALLSYPGLLCKGCRWNFAKGSCAAERWIVYQNTHIWNGMLYKNSQSVDSCKQECSNNVWCVGIDWNKAGLRSNRSHHCWLHGLRTIGKTKNRWVGVVHYQLRRYSCTAKRVARAARRWTRKYNRE